MLLNTISHNFIGSQQDGESDYFALGARMYDPSIGRFLSPDPLLEMFPEQTPYQYAFNSPLIWKDPSGLKGEKERGDKMMGMETLLLQIANFFVDVARNMVDNSNKNCKCSDTWACPCANDDKGGSSGESGASVGLNNLGNTYNSGRLASDGDGKSGDYKGDGGSGMEYAREIGSNIIRNWISLNTNQQEIIADAILKIVSVDDERRIQKYLELKHSFDVDFRSGYDLAKSHNILMCENIKFIPGLNVHHGRGVKGGCEGTLQQASLKYGIYFADEFENDPENEYLKGKLYLDQMGKIDESFLQFWHVFAHEFAHEYYNVTFIGPVTKEQQETNNDYWVKNIIQSIQTNRRKKQ